MSNYEGQNVFLLQNSKTFSDKKTRINLSKVIDGL
jgi:hypothetical protein